MEEVDLIAGPVTPTPAFKIGEKIDNPLAMYLFDLYTVSTNLAGIAALSIPCGSSSTGLPIGLHLQAPAFEEERLLRGAHMFQRATDWHARKPLDGVIEISGRQRMRVLAIGTYTDARELRSHWPMPSRSGLTT